MEFTPRSQKKAIKIRFIDGSLDRFDGKTLSVSMGEKGKPLTRRKFVLLCRKVVALSKQNKAGVIEINFKDLKSLAPKEMGDFEIGEVAGSAFVMADYEPTTYKTKPKDGWSNIKTIAITNTPSIGKEGFWKGHQIADAVNNCRELANTPGADMTPKVLAEAAKKMIKGTKATVEVLGQKQIENLKMGAVLGVSRGSVHEPQFIVMEYHGAGEKDKPVVFVGKGITFDTGGVQVKPGDHMYEMHMDMSGGASVLCAVALAAKLRLKVNIIALVPAVENNLGGNAIRPGDILKGMSGKTIEVLHTDAEGRLIMSDAITYAKRYNPSLIVDVSTLTGASLIALGQEASAFMVNDEGKIMEYMDIAEKSGDYMWPLPAWEEYEAMLKSTFADLANIPSEGNSRYAGVIGAGMFVKKFVDDLKTSWLHIDMAPRMTATQSEYLAKGAAGAPVRFLLKLLESRQKA